MKDNNTKAALGNETPLDYEDENLVFLTLVENVAFLKISRACNNKCIFCCDTTFQNGGFMDTDLVVSKMIEGRKKGIQELFLTGGEPTIHPDFLKFISIGKKLGYQKIQCITNGRMFAYDDFARKALAKGITEVIVSINSLNPSVHNLLSGNRNAYEQAMKGIENIQKFGDIPIQINTLVTKMNYTDMPGMAPKLKDIGVNFWNVILVNPAGRSYPRHKEKLFLDYDEVFPYFRKTLAASKAAGLKLHIKKFPYNFYEDYEQYLTDPDSLFHEIREDQLRRDVYRNFIERMEMPECHGERCRYCYLRKFCDFLESFARNYRDKIFSGIRGKTEEVQAHKKTISEIADVNPEMCLWIDAEKTEKQKEALNNLFSLARNVFVDCPEPSGILNLDIPEDTEINIVIRKINELQDLLESKDVTAVVPVDTHTSEEILKNHSILREYESRIIFILENFETIEEAREKYIDLNDFFYRLPLKKVRTSNIPLCISASRSEISPCRYLDLSVISESGITWGHFIRSYVKNQCYTKSRRCSKCHEYARCKGIPVHYVRIYGYKSLRPIVGDGPK